MDIQVNIAVCHNHYRAGSVLDTVIDISDDEWDEIYEAYDYPEMWAIRFEHGVDYPFSKFIKELVEWKLKEKGVTINGKMGKQHQNGKE